MKRLLYTLFEHHSRTGEYIFVQVHIPVIELIDYRRGIANFAYSRIIECTLVLYLLKSLNEALLVHNHEIDKNRKANETIKRQTLFS